MGRKMEERIILGVKHEKENWYYFSFSCPVSFQISLSKIFPEGSGEMAIAVSGTSSYNKVLDSEYLAGDYSLVIVSKTKVQSIECLIKYNQISNLVVYQLLSEICKLLGSEPSQMLNQSAKSCKENIPFYRKIRSDIENTSKKILDNIRSPEKGSVVNVSDEIEKLKSENKKLYDKLKEAEDYIDELSS